MLENLSSSELELLVGKQKMNIFEQICKWLEENYELETIFNQGGKKWDYEYKLKKGSKTLCGFYFKKDVLGFMVIFGKVEREKVEQNWANYSSGFQKYYEQATTYHDGKWVMLELEDLSLLEDMKQIVQIKRKIKK